MSFTDKVADKITAPLNGLSHDLSESIMSVGMTAHNTSERITRQVTVVSAYGMIAFTLISIVAITALVKASK